MNPFRHVDLRVTDLSVAVSFYSKLLPALGFVRDDSGETWQVFQTDGEPTSAPWFAFVLDRDHRPNANRIAFQAESQAEVDRLAAVALEAGACNMSGPRSCPEYSAGYYAAFFEDPCGNPLEICHTTT